MDSCLIFCAGEFDKLAAPVAPGDMVLAADGGLAHLEKLGLMPGGILGDFDSLGYIPEGAQVFPVEKDDTDSMLAARKALELGYGRVVFYGALDGPRLDHTMANFQTLCFLAQRGARAYLVGRRYLVTAVHNGQVTFPEKAKGILSVFCLGEEARGVTLRGLQYPMEGGSLSSSFPLGVSNHFLGCQALVRVERGTLLLMYDVENGFPLGE